MWNQINNFLIRCVAYDIEKQYCDAAAGRQYYFPARTREDCEAYGLGCQTPNFVVTGLLVNVSAEQCNQMKGVMKPLFEWFDATWVGGRMLTTHWERRQMLYPNQLKTTLDFNKFQYYVTLPTDFEIVTLFQNEVSVFCCC